MFVRLKTTFASPDGRTGQAGEVIDMPEDQARVFIDAGNAEEAPSQAAPGTLTQAGSFGGTPASPATSGQTPGIGSGAPDPLVGHVPAVERTPPAAAVPAAPEPEAVVNQDALAAPSEETDEKRGKKKG